MLDEYWEVEWVQYQPNRSDVLIGGHYRVVTASGKVVSEFQNVHTTQAALDAKAPADTITWGDTEIAAIVLEQTGVPCVFYEPPASPVEPEPPVEP